MLEDQDRKTLMRTAALFSSLNFEDPELPSTYHSKSVAHSLRQVSLKPSSSKRAKVKAARKQRKSSK
jgi:hypothetical protein